MPRGRRRQTPQAAKRDSEKRILGALLEGPKTYKKLLEKTKLSEPTLTERLKDLEKQNKISMKINPKDRRSKIYSISPAGITHLKKEKIFEEISQSSLKLVVPRAQFPEWLGDPHFSATCESKTVKKWKKLLSSQFKQYLKKHYPDLNKKDRLVMCDVFVRRFFDCLELNMRLNIFSNLDLPPVDTSKWSVLQAKQKKGLYAKVWSHLFEAAVLLVFEVYKQHSNFEEFMKDGHDKKLMLNFGVTIPFQRLLEHMEEWAKETVAEKTTP